MAERHETELTHEEAKSRAARGVVSVFGRHALVRALAFLGTLVLARLIAPESFGLFVTAQFVLSVLQALAVGGVTSAVVRRREAVEPADYRTALTLQQILAVVVVAALFVAAPWVVAAYGLPPERALVFRVMALAVFPLSLRSIPLAMLQRGLRHDLTAICEVLEYVVYLVTSIGLALLGWDVWALVAATLARQVVGAVVMQRMARTLPRFGWERDRVRALLRTAVPLQGQMLIDLAQRSMIPVAVGFLFGVAAVGITGMANTILEALVLQPLAMIASVQLRMFARIQDDAEAMRDLLRDCYMAATATFLPLVTLLAITAPTVMPHLLSAKWHEVGTLLPWMVGPSLIYILSMASSQAAKALGELRIALVAGLINMAIQFAVLIATAPILGLGAYPLASFAGVLVGAVLVMNRVRRRVGELPFRGSWPFVAATAAAALVCLPAFVFDASAPVMLLGVAAGVAVYLGVTVVLAGHECARFLRFLGSGGRSGGRSWAGRLADVVEKTSLLAPRRPPA